MNADVAGAAMSSLKYSEQIISYLGRQFDLEEEQVVLMLPKFTITLSSHMERLEEAFANNDIEHLGKAGHTIRGAFLNLGLSDCAEIAQQIEYNCKNGEDLADYRVLIAKLRMIVNEIISE